jgi:hypothetical protein
MGVMGTTQGSKILLDLPLGLPDGTRVEVDIAPVGTPRKGSPESLMRLVGTLSDAEAEQILNGAQECRRVDPTLWNRAG